jgi:hypothetical protein
MLLELQKVITKHLKVKEVSNGLLVNLECFGPLFIRKLHFFLLNINCLGWNLRKKLKKIIIRTSRLKFIYLL